MNVVVVGNGFLGHRIALDAKSQGDSVTVFARSEKPGDDLLQNRGIKLKYFNQISDITNSTQLLKEDRSYVILAVGIASPQLFEMGKVSSESQALIDFFDRTAQELKLHPEVRVGYISSGGTVYGDSTVANTEESLCNPVTAYGKFHYGVETSLSRILNDQLVRLRLANPYGEEQTHRHHQGLISYVYNQITMGNSVDLYGMGCQIRDYIEVNGAAKVINAVMRKGATPTVINIGTGVGTTNLEIANLVAEVLGIQPKFNLLPARSFDINFNVLATDVLSQLGVDIPPPISKASLAYLLSK